jgi:carboxylesterase type B
MKRLSLFTALLWLGSLAFGQCSTAPPVGAAVWTGSGLIEGHAAPNRSSVSEYLGIPYGQAPVGDLRFAAPVAFHSNGTYKAANFVSF